MPIKIVRLYGDDYQKHEKIAEFVDGELRGWPQFVEEFDWLQGANEEEVYRTFDYPPGSVALPMDDPDNVKGPDDSNEVGWFPDPEWGPGGDDEEDETDDATEKAAEDIVERVLDDGGPDTGNAKRAAETDYERADDVLREMHKRLVEWEGDDLTKAPTIDGSDDIPQFVAEQIKEVIKRGVVFDHFEGYSRQAAKAIQNSLEDNLTQPQGWSIGSIVDDFQDMYPGMTQEKALNIARTEVSAIVNTAREEAYEEREDADEYEYYWQGPTTKRTTEVCKEIKEEVEDRGGSVPMGELRDILREKAVKYEGTAEGGTPERVDEWTPHFQCRHTFVRDVKSSL